MKHGYLVMRLQTEVKITDIYGKQHNAKVSFNGVKGYCPIFTNKKDAIKSSDKGKYQIIKINEVG